MAGSNGSRERAFARFWARMLAAFRSWTESEPAPVARRDHQSGGARQEDHEGGSTHMDQRSSNGSKRIDHFVYKLIPPRATFATDMSDAEAGIMAQHIGYWRGLTDRGTAIVFGPVADPAGVWGLAVVNAESAEDVYALGMEDPAVKSEMSTFQVFSMPDAIVRS
jgi:uncharacterized protein